MDHAGTRTMLAEFGVPPSSAPAAAWGLCAAELAVAAGLLVGSTVTLAGMAAAVLQSVFAVAIFATLHRGKRPVCRCFGAMAAAPIGWITLARNAALAVGALIVSAAAANGGGQGLGAFWRSVSAMSGLERAVAALAGCVALLSFGWLLLLRQYGRLLLRVEFLEVGASVPTTGRIAGLPIGIRAPWFDLPNQGGGQTSLDNLLSPKRSAVLFFGSASCASCGTLLPEIASWREAAPAFGFALLTSGDQDLLVPQGIRPEEVVAADEAIFSAYQLTLVPAMVLVRHDGFIFSPTAVGPDAIRRLLVDLGRPSAMAPRSEQPAADTVPLR